MSSEDERSANRAAVDRFFELPIGDERLELYADDAVKELVTMGLRWAGEDALKANTGQNADWFPEWTWSNVQVWGTEDPETFWVECDGAGRKVFAAGSDPLPIGNHYVFHIRARDGRIALLREFGFKIEPPRFP
jgi:phenazine biosynthesis protein